MISDERRIHSGAAQLFNSFQGTSVILSVHPNVIMDVLIGIELSKPFLKGDVDNGC